MNDPISSFDDRVVVEDLSRTDAAADVALFLEGAEHIDGLIVAEATSDGEDVVVLAHGFFNFMVGRALRRRGWRLTANQGWKYWSTRRYERS